MKRYFLLFENDDGSSVTLEGPEWLRHNISRTGLLVTVEGEGRLMKYVNFETEEYGQYDVAAIDKKQKEFSETLMSLVYSGLEGKDLALEIQKARTQLDSELRGRIEGSLRRCGMGVFKNPPESALTD